LGGRWVGHGDPVRALEEAAVLTLTPDAAEAVRQLVSDSPVESGGGVRIAPGDPTPTGIPLQVTMAAEPEATDQTIEDSGARVFVDSDAVEALDDKVLDAAVDDAGRVRFAIGGPGAEAGEPPPAT
jgi:iron-sulfur cluster assembly protein